MKDEQAPRRLIAATLFATESAAMLPSAYEQLIAQQYIASSLSIQQAIALLEEYNSIHITHPCPASSVAYAMR